MIQRFLLRKSAPGIRLTRRFDANDFNVAPFDNPPYDTLWAVSNLLCLIPVHCRTPRSDVNAFLDLSLGGIRRLRGVQKVNSKTMLLLLLLLFLGRAGAIFKELS